MELYKVLHQRRMILVVAALGVFSFVLQIGFRFQGRNPLVFVARRANLDPELILNAINSTRLIMNSCYYLFLPLLTAMIFAGMVAGERASGTLWGVLSRPVSRHRLLAAKFAVSTLTLCLVVLFFVGFTLAVGVTLFGVHDFMTASVVFELLDTDNRAVLPFSEGVLRLFLCALLLTYLLLPMGALSFYCSVLFRNTHSAMAAALLLFFMSYILQGLGSIDWLPMFGTIRPFLFTTAMESWMYLFQPEIGWGDIWPRAVLHAVYIGALLSAALVHFQQIDLCE